MIKEKREKLYLEVIEKRRQGLSAVEIAKLFDITRQRVYQLFIRFDEKRKRKA